MSVASEITGVDAQEIKGATQNLTYSQNSSQV